MASDSYFICMQMEDPALDSLFAQFKADVGQYSIHPLTAYVPLDINFGNEQWRDEEDSLSESYSSDIEMMLREIEDQSYDEANAPKVGVQFQVDIDLVLSESKFESESQVRDKEGELVWDPSALSLDETDRFLAETQCKIEDDVDDFYSPARNPDTTSLANVDALSPEAQRSVTLITQEQALAVLHRHNYNVDAAKEELATKKEAWSAKKRDFEPWSEGDVAKFETGMRVFHKRFRKILRGHMPDSSKNLKQIMHFYYTWKKMPRFHPWKKRRFTMRPSFTADGAPGLTDSQQLAPTKEDEFFEFRQFMGLRSRPRIDYLQSGSGQHIWRSASGGYKRKQRAKDESSDTEDDKEFPPLEVFNISINGDVDLDFVRATKRARREPIDYDDAKLLLEVEAQEEEVRKTLRGDGKGEGEDAMDVDH